ncbi:hypothetical protein ACFW0H_00325 [Pseudomonas sp. CR3202]|uniref:hypothetical protein n=1 Tax=Pseudomonas sp. CR3202 TaxID=3351532 RepID=UPI003BF1F626
MNPCTLALAGLGAALHVYIATFGSANGLDAFTAPLMFWAFTPYVVCVLLLAAFRAQLVPLLAVGLVLVADCALFLSVFAWPDSATASAELSFAPLGNLLVSIPFGVLLGWLAEYRAHK